jgi:hypothetical protein
VSADRPRLPFMAEPGEYVAEPFTAWAMWSRRRKCRLRQHHHHGVTQWERVGPSKLRCNRCGDVINFSEVGPSGSTLA